MLSPSAKLDALKVTEMYKLMSYMKTLSHIKKSNVRSKIRVFRRFCWTKVTNEERDILTAVHVS